ncbi:hypothetical protein BDR26DRAFT_873481, partial [Obelidium mucronatum]
MRNTHSEFVAVCEQWTAEKTGDLARAKTDHAAQQRQRSEALAGLGADAARVAAHVAAKKDADAAAQAAAAAHEAATRQLAAKQQRLAAETAALAAEVARLEASAEERSRRLAAAIAAREERTLTMRRQKTVLRAETGAGDCVCCARCAEVCVYSHFEARTGTKSFLLCLTWGWARITRSRISTLPTAVTALDEHVAFLNSSRDFYRFLKEMRCCFVEYAKKRDQKES